MRVLGELSSVPTTGEPVRSRERWGRVRWRLAGYGNGSGVCMESGWDGDIHLHDGGIRMLICVVVFGGSGGVGGSVIVYDTDGVGSGGDVGSSCCNGRGAGSVGGSLLCGSGI